MLSRSIVALFMVIALGTFTGCQSDYPATGAPQDGERTAVAPRQVRVLPATQDTVSRGTVVTGTFAAEDQVVLSFKVAGRLRVRVKRSPASIRPTFASG
jgi:hypothetical protein